MAMSRSLLEFGHDEDRDVEVCSYCASDGKLQPALYFCFDCGLCGKFICGQCLNGHTKFVKHHAVGKIGNQSTFKRAQEHVLKIKTLHYSNEEQQKDYYKDYAALFADLKEVKRENEILSKELHDCKEALALGDAKSRLETKIKERERHKERQESQLIFKEKDDTNTGYSKQRELADGKLHSSVLRTKSYKLIVVGIEISNEGSWYAFSFRMENETDPLKVSSNRDWCSGREAVMSLKNSSVVLFDENKKFLSFGLEAEEDYYDLVADCEDHKCFFFKNFLMKLQGTDITRDFEIDDDKGRKMKAIDVFGAVIKYLKDHLLGLLLKTGTVFQNKEIHWVLTVPAIWTDSAKRLMGESAHRADIAETQLTIVTEPEAAIVCYQMEKQVNKLTTADISSPGTKCMVIDLGRTTANFTILERQPDGGLLEIKAALDIACGVNIVTGGLYEAIRIITGDKVYQKWIVENADDQNDFQREIEGKLRSIRYDSNSFQPIKVPISIDSVTRRINHESLSQATEKSQYKDKFKWIGNKLRIDIETVKNLFKPYTDRIVANVKYLLKEPGVEETSIFLMIGKLSEFPKVQMAIKKAFPTVNVIIPEVPDTVVMKGAVIYGHQH